MTYSEFEGLTVNEDVAGNRFGIVFLRGKPVYLAEPNGELQWVPEKGRNFAEKVYRAVIRQTIRDGEKVPKEVLDNYPDSKLGKPLGTKAPQLNLAWQ